MATIVAKAQQSTHLNSIAPRMAKASIVVNRSEASAEIADSDAAVSLVFECIASVGMSDKEAAYTMAMDPAQLARVKTKQARLPIDALWRMPDAFWLEFRRRVDEAKGLSEEHARSVRAARIAELIRLLVEVA
jgi:hypothetical protein